MPTKPRAAPKTRRPGQGRPTPAANLPAAPAPTGDAEPPSSERSNARREQFLEVATQIVRERGIGGVTMERLAEEAGVSKALPYRYFDNADAVFVELYKREIGGLVGRVASAMRKRKDGEGPIAAMVGTYFDVVSERGDILVSLAGSGSPIPALVEDSWKGPDFLAAVLTEAYGVKGREARLLASIVQSAVVGASDCVGRGEISRPMAEKLTITALGAAVAAIAADDEPAKRPATSKKR